MEGNYDAARTAAGTFRDIFLEKIISISRSRTRGLAMESRINPSLFQLEKDLRQPLVATNDSHYLCEDDAPAQDVMLCIQTGKSIQRHLQRMKFWKETSFSSRAMTRCTACSRTHREVLSRTLDIAERCSLRLEKVATPFPQFDVPSGYSIDSYFVRVTREGFARRLESLRPLHEQGKLKHSLADYDQRLERELAIIQQDEVSGIFPHRMGFHPATPESTTFRWAPGFGDRRRDRWFPLRARHHRSRSHPARIAV